MAKQSYFEKLKDPRWQKKRLEVMEKAGFACERCYDTKSTLHVHHKAYIKGREPWEYQYTQLACLCLTCHEVVHGSEDIYTLVGSFAPVDATPWDRDACASIVAGYLCIDVERKKELFSRRLWILGRLMRELSTNSLEKILAVGAVIHGPNSDEFQHLREALDELAPDLLPDDDETA